MGHSSRIDHLFYPHIVEAVVAEADYKTKLRFRATCRALRRFTDGLLLEEVVDVDHSDYDCYDWPIVRPYTGTEYPFFKPEGDRPKLRSSLAYAQALWTVGPVSPTLVNSLLHETVTIEFDHWIKEWKLHPLEAGWVSCRGRQLDWDCSCYDKNNWQPVFHHAARCVDILYVFNDDLLARLSSHCEELGKKSSGSLPQCHLLRHIINEGVTDLTLTFMPRISQPMIDHLPACLLPNAASLSLNPVFHCTVELPVTSPSIHIKKRIKSAFAKHLRVAKGAISVLMGGDAGEDSDSDD